MAPKRLVYKSRVFEIECVDMSNEEIMTHLNDRLHLPQGAYVRLRKRAGSSNPEVWEASVEVRVSWAFACVDGGNPGQTCLGLATWMCHLVGTPRNYCTHIHTLRRV